MEEKKNNDLEAVRQISELLKDFNESERKRIIRWSFERLGMELDKFEKAPNQSQFKTETNNNKSIKDFYNEKKPTSDTQFTVFVAYYYKFIAPEDQRNDFINSDILQNATRLVNRERLKKPIDTLNNCVKSGLLDKTKERGKFVINTVGENLIAMTLPEKNKK